MEADKIREFISNNLAVLDDDVSFTDKDNIFEMGIVDSPFAVMLVMFIEEEFGVEVLDTDLDIENFNSVKRIMEFIARKRGRQVS